MSRKGAVGGAGEEYRPGYGMSDAPVAGGDIDVIAASIEDAVQQTISSPTNKRNTVMARAFDAAHDFKNNINTASMESNVIDGPSVFPNQYLALGISNLPGSGVDDFTPIQTSPDIVHNKLRELRDIIDLKHLTPQGVDPIDQKYLLASDNRKGGNFVNINQAISDYGLSEYTLDAMKGNIFQSGACFNGGEYLLSIPYFLDGASKIGIKKINDDIQNCEVNTSRNLDEGNADYTLTNFYEGSTHIMTYNNATKQQSITTTNREYPPGISVTAESDDSFSLNSICIALKIPPPRNIKGVVLPVTIRKTGGPLLHDHKLRLKTNVALDKTITDWAQMYRIIDYELQNKENKVVIITNDEFFLKICTLFLSTSFKPSFVLFTGKYVNKLYCFNEEKLDKEAMYEKIKANIKAVFPTLIERGASMNTSASTSDPLVDILGEVQQKIRHIIDVCQIENYLGYFIVKDLINLQRRIETFIDQFRSYFSNLSNIENKELLDKYKFLALQTVEDYVINRLLGEAIDIVNYYCDEVTKEITGIIGRYVPKKAISSKRPRVDQIEGNLDYESYSILCAEEVYDYLTENFTNLNTDEIGTLFYYMSSLENSHNEGTLRKNYRKGQMLYLTTNNPEAIHAFNNAHEKNVRSKREAAMAEAAGLRRSTRVTGTAVSAGMDYSEFNPPYLQMSFCELMLPILEKMKSSNEGVSASASSSTIGAATTMASSASARSTNDESSMSVGAINRGNFTVDPYFLEIIRARCSPISTSSIPTSASSIGGAAGGRSVDSSAIPIIPTLDGLSAYVEWFLSKSVKTNIETTFNLIVGEGGLCPYNPLQLALQPAYPLPNKCLLSLLLNEAARTIKEKEYWGPILCSTRPSRTLADVRKQLDNDKQIESIKTKESELSLAKEKLATSTETLRKAFVRFNRVNKITQKPGVLLTKVLMNELRIAENLLNKAQTKVDDSKKNFAKISNDLQVLKEKIEHEKAKPNGGKRSLNKVVATAAASKFTEKVAVAMTGGGGSSPPTTSTTKKPASGEKRGRGEQSTGINYEDEGEGEGADEGENKEDENQGGGSYSQRGGGSPDNQINLLTVSDENYDKMIKTLTLYLKEDVSQKYPLGQNKILLEVWRAIWKELDLNLDNFYGVMTAMLEYYELNAYESNSLVEYRGEYGKFVSLEEYANEYEHEFLLQIGHYLFNSTYLSYIFLNSSSHELLSAIINAFVSLDKTLALTPIIETELYRTRMGLFDKEEEPLEEEETVTPVSSISQGDITQQPSQQSLQPMTNNRQQFLPNQRSQQNINSQFIVKQQNKQIIGSPQPINNTFMPQPMNQVPVTQTVAPLLAQPGLAGGAARRTRSRINRNRRTRRRYHTYPKQRRTIRRHRNNRTNHSRHKPRHKNDMPIAE